MSKGFDRKNMDMYQQFFFYSPIAMIIVDIKTGDILDINKTAIDYYGYSADEFLGLKIFDLNAEDASYRAEWIKDINRFKSLLCKHRLKDREIRDVEVSSEKINLDGKNLNILLVVDVTDKLQVEKDLRKDRDRLGLVITSTKTGIWDYDYINNSVYIDKQLKAILGYEEHELTGGAEEWRSRWHPKDKDKITQALQQCLEGKTDHYEVEHRMRHKDGSYRWVSATVKTIYNEKRQPIRAVGTMSDITERLEVDRMLKFTYELQRKSDFLNDILSGNIAKDENTIMMANEFGINLDTPLYCCLIYIQEAPESNNVMRNSKYSKSQMNQIIYLISNNTNFIVWDNRDKIGVLCQDENNTKNTWKESMSVASKLKEIICSAKPDIEIMIGISDIHCGTSSIKNSYREAAHTLISAQCEVPDNGGIYHYKDAGLFQILSLIYGKDYALEFVRKMIGPLIEYDSVKGSNLLNTLEEILQSNNLKDAANKLFIHYKTLFFRKQRLEKILGVSLDNVDTRLALAAAVKLHKLIKINLFHKDSSETSAVSRKDKKTFLL